MITDLIASLLHSLLSLNLSRYGIAVTVGHTGKLTQRLAGRQAEVVQAATHGVDRPEALSLWIEGFGHLSAIKSAF